MVDVYYINCALDSCNILQRLGEKYLKRITLKFRICILVIIFTLAPLFVQLSIGLKTTTENLTASIQALNESVNQNYLEKFDNYINQTVKIIEIVPQSADVLTLEGYDRERVIRKLVSSDSSIKRATLADSNGIVLFSTDTSLMGTDAGEEMWYTEALKGNRYISNSFIDEKMHIPLFTISVPILDQMMRPAGVISVQIGFDHIQSIIQNIKTGETGYTYIVDKNGIVLAHPKYKEMVLNKYNAVTNLIKGAVNVVKGQKGTEEYKNSEGKDVIGTYDIIPATGWGIISEIELREVLEPVEKEKAEYVKTAIVFFLIAAAASYLLAVMITKPLLAMSKVAGEYQNGILSRRITVKSNDEIGKLQKSFNAMADSLAAILAEVNKAVEEVNVFTRELSDGANISAASIEEISAIVANVAEGASNQLASLDETNSIANEVALTVESVSNSSREVADSAKEAAQKAQEGSDNIKLVNEKMEVIKSNVENSAALVEKLGTKSLQVSGIVKIIREIAERTNMLALNAAIEAARAGEAGRGFTVVADEVRKLADQTKEASMDIEKVIEEIQKETMETVDAMHEGLKDVEHSVEAIAETNSAFDNIISMIKTVSEKIIQVSESVYQLKDEMSKINDSLDKVSQVSMATSEGTQNILAGTEEQASALQQINESAARLNEMAENLQKTVGRFKL